MSVDHREMANQLLEVGCLQVSFNPLFTYASGLQGPMYCDNRKIHSFVAQRKIIYKGLQTLLQSANINYDYLAGLATAGIPFASVLANEEDVPMVYVRSKPKGHGKKNLIEGHCEEGSRLLMVEDLVNQGSSLAKALDGVLEQGMKPVGCLCVVDYQMEQARNILEEYGIPLFSLTKFEDIAQCALERSDISQAQFEELLNWQRDPKNWP